ncbi:MAG: ROK family protein [Lachnospiraceae bacterium]|nr:ROK family protein [Lachnospiraceae bacterium]MCI9281878.1 ROK family protein [Lachnospiraceae bacterium]
MKQKTVLGIDIGGTKVGIGLVTNKGKIWDSLRYPQRYCDIEEWTEELSEKIQELLERNALEVEVTAIGVGSRGHVDFRNQRLLSTTIMKVTPGFDLCGRLKNQFGLPVYIDNDVKAAACGELLFGAGIQFQDFVCYNVGTGIAAAVVVNGKLVRGKGNNAGEIGYDLLAGPASDSSFRDLESQASGRGIERVTGMPAAVVFDKARNGGRRAEEAVDRVLYLLSASVVNIAHLLDPQLFTFVGGVVSDPWFFDRLQRNVRAMTGQGWRFQLQVSNLGVDKIGILGAAGVALYKRRI